MITHENLPRSPRSVARRFSVLAAVAWGAAMTAGGVAAEWQWSVPVARSEGGSTSRTWLWIPPDCGQVRGVVLAQQQMQEVSILESPAFRAGLARLGFAAVWCAPPFDRWFRMKEGAGETFDRMMAELADVSGYAELVHAPVVALGHSAYSNWPFIFAAWMPDRTLAAISISGNWPYSGNFTDGSPRPDVWNERTVDFIPCLEAAGEYENADRLADKGLEVRREHPLTPLSVLAAPGEGHFATTEKKARYLAFYIEKAAHYRIPAGKTEGAPRLLPIDPTRTGWLAAKWRRDEPPPVARAPVNRYGGNPAEAFWFFDEEHARVTEDYQASHRGLKPQLIGYVQNDAFVPQQNNHMQVKLDFQPAADGVTFKLQAKFHDRVPAGSPRLPVWAKLPVGSPLGHAASGDISIDRISGPFQKVSANSFVVRFLRETRFNAPMLTLVFAATHPGDRDYKAAVQHASMSIPGRNAEGMRQEIVFDHIADQKAGTATLKLAAKSSAQVPVSFTVREGPAEIEGDTLRFTPIPPRARLPLKVTVIAWQYGRAAEPRLQSAEPVERIFNIVP